MAAVKNESKNQALISLTDLRLIALTTYQLLAAGIDRVKFHCAFIAILNQAANAGNAIIVIDCLYHFIVQSKLTGIAMSDLLKEFLALPSLHSIGTGTPAEYRTHLRTLGGFILRFHEVVIDTTFAAVTIGAHITVELLQQRAHADYDTQFEARPLQ